MTPRDRAARAFSEHRAVVEAVAARILRDPDEARDVASETFLALLEKGPVSAQAERSWLLTSARNRALNRARDRSNYRRKALRAVPESIEHADDSAFGDDAAAELVRRALERLSKRDAEAVKLRFIDERSYDHIAERLGISPAQARVVVHRASRRLRGETVLLLAEHHGAGNDCTKRLVKRVRAHRGCSTCEAVVDEVSALSSYGIALLFLPAIQRGFDSLMRGAGRMRMRLPAGGGRMAEVVAAAIVAGSMTLPASAPASPATPRPMIPAVAPAALGPGAPQVRGAGTVPGAGAVRNLPPNATQIVNDGDDGDPVVESGSLRGLGMPSVVTDALDVRGEAGVDIRRFEVAAIRDAAGRTTGLLMKFALAGPIPAGAGYGVDWRFENGCTAEVYVQRAGTEDVRFQDDGQYRVECTPAGPPSHTAGESSQQHTDDGEEYGGAMHYFRPLLYGHTVELRLIFSEFEDDFLRFLGPGSVLRNVYAYTDLAAVGSDRAPDGNAGFDYRVPK